MTNTVIFVDIDGVLLPTKAWQMPENTPFLNARMADCAQRVRFWPEAISLLVRLADLSGAKLVLSSNWRRSWPHGRDALQQKLIAEGLRADLWHEDWFPEITGRGKGAEIAEWIEYYRPDRALIIDDEGYQGPALAEGVAVVIRPNTDEGYDHADHWTICSHWGVDDPAPQADALEVSAAATETPPVLKTSRDRFVDGEIDGMPLGEFLSRIGCDILAPGKCKLWYKGDGGSGGRWLYVTAPDGTGEHRPGYPMTLAMGDDDDSKVTVLVCSLLKSQDRTGSAIIFDKCNRIEMDGETVVASGALSEQELIGVLRDENFSPTPFDFEAAA